MPAILRCPGSCFAKPEATRSGVIFDARDYYRAFYHAAAGAEHYILLAGWEFDSDVELLRGTDARDSPFPTTFRSFLLALCASKPNLRVYILAWDYSAFYVLEREWMQRLIFDWTTPRALSFRFDRTHASGGSHHQKLVVVDDRIAFAGGMDFARSRWDDRRHATVNPLRREGTGMHGPYHDVGAYVTGPAVRTLRNLFLYRWEAATGERIELPRLDMLPTVEAPIPADSALPLHAKRVCLSQTRGALGPLTASQEIFELYRRAIRRAAHSIYLETQYFTSSTIRDALVSRMRDESRARPDIVMIKPSGADTPKERVVLGDIQEELLASLARVASETGSRFGVYNSIATDEAGNRVSTFIHAKLLIVDNRLLSIGSANLTNRSMKLDSELNVSWEAESHDEQLAHEIAIVRANLLAEHTGAAEPILATEGLVDRLDAIANDPQSKLVHYVINQPARLTERVLRLERIFDPDKPLTDVELFEALQIPGVAMPNG